MGVWGWQPPLTARTDYEYIHCRSNVCQTVEYCLKTCRARCLAPCHVMKPSLHARYGPPARPCCACPSYRGQGQHGVYTPDNLHRWPVCCAETPRPPSLARVLRKPKQISTFGQYRVHAPAQLHHCMVSLACMPLRTQTLPPQHTCTQPPHSYPQGITARLPQPPYVAQNTPCGAWA